MAKKETAKIILDGKTYNFPIIIGTQGERAIDISNLRNETAHITLDNGFGNTGSCTSNITFLDGEKGILRYRGIPIERLAKKSTFIETAYLIIYGHLPTQGELERFSRSFTEQAMIHEGMKDFFNGYPYSAHPMGILSAMIGSLSGYYPELVKSNPTKEDIDLCVVELLSKVRTICAFSYKKSIGEPYVYPRHDLKYIPNFLNMMFSSPAKQYEIHDVVVRALETLFILHADHEQNCSTSTVRLVGSSWANLFASVSAAINALWGPLHGGANQGVIEMLEDIVRNGGDLKKYVNKAKDPKDKFRLMGFGHRVYKNFDPRAKIIKKSADELLKKLGIDDPLLDLAKQLEEIALKDSYFIERKLYPNVDFYSGIIYRAIGIPMNMFPVMFAIARLPGWIAHWKEMLSNPKARIGRPRQIYTGIKSQEYVPIGARKYMYEKEHTFGTHEG
ncbi:MAG: citrate synthase [Candidatus Zapsychrus exili]|nr:citrate synthase [Candidatus Zapsychrus exili]